MRMVTRATAKKAMKKEKERNNKWRYLSRKIVWKYNVPYYYEFYSPKLSIITQHFQNSLESCMTIKSQTFFGIYVLFSLIY